PTKMCNPPEKAAECSFSIGNSTDMLHDRAMSRSLSQRRNTQPQMGFESGATCDDRRHADRVPFPAEMVLLWNHDASLRHRYQVIDASDSGYRIATALPLQ